VVFLLPERREKMSLDVWLTMNNAPSKEGSGIFIRENGQTKEISRAKWDEKFPGKEPVVVQDNNETNKVYSANITHNLNTMASKAGIYDYLWQPNEIGITKAHQLIEPLEKGLLFLRDDPAFFKQFNPENGWGDYDGLVRFTQNYLEVVKSIQMQM